MTLINLGHTTPEQDAALLRTIAEVERTMDDTLRLDALERLLWSDKIGNGVALFSCRYANGDREKFISVEDLGDQDGSDLGEQLVQGPTLREALDKLLAGDNA